MGSTPSQTQALLGRVLAPGALEMINDLEAAFPAVIVDPDQAVVWQAPAVRELLVCPAVTVEMGDRPVGERLVDRLPAMTDDPQARAALAAMRPLLMPTRVAAQRGEARGIAVSLLETALRDSAATIDLAPVTDALTPLFLRRILGLDEVIALQDIVMTSRDISVVVLADHGLADGLTEPQVREAAERLGRFDRDVQGALPACAADAAHPLCEVAGAFPAPMVAAAIAQVIAGGMDTVSSSICLAVSTWVDAACPPLTREAAEDLWSGTVTARPPIQVIARRTRADAVVDGVRIPAGCPVVVPTKAAVATDTRMGDRSLAFGWGEHRCIGRAVAQVAAVEALLAIAAAWPDGLPWVRAGGARFPWIFDGPAQLTVPHPTFLPASAGGRPEGGVNG